MKSSWVLLLLFLSVAFLAGAYFLLPDLRLNDSQDNRIERPERLLKQDTLALPKLSNATFARVILERDVRAGDTLGYILKDRYRKLRDSLVAFAKTNRSTANFDQLPSHLKSDFNALMLEVNQMQRPPKPKRRSRFILSEIEREYLNSEIMGAEDASTELIGKLSHFEDSGQTNSMAAQNARVELRKKQAFIASAKKRLSQRVKYSEVTDEKAGPPNLTEAQRDGILALSDQLPIDSQRVLAPIAGRYYRPGNGVGYIIGLSEVGQQYDSNKHLKSDKFGYILEAQGSPVLWGKAQRKQQLESDDSTSGTKLRVQVD